MSSRSISSTRNHITAYIQMLRERIDREAIEGYGFALPYLLVFAVFLLYPLVRGFYLSLFDLNPFFPSQTTFVGLQNYIELFHDPLFWNALFNTVYFVVLTVPTMVVLALLLALGVNRNIMGQKVLRTIFFSPYVLTVSVVGLLWTEIFESQGLLNYYLGFIMENPPNWLLSPMFAMPAIAIATVWWTVAFNFIILLAARQNVPERLYEAARLDGASSWRAMCDITVPQLKNPLIFVVVTSFIASFQVFGQPFIMTGGGPAHATETIVMYLFNSAFASGELGYAAAIGYVLFLILIVVSIGNYVLLLGGDTDQ